MMDPKMIIVSAPSGAGKTTLVQSLLDTFPQLGFSISCTTRNKRQYEEHGKDYYFITPEVFQSNIQEEAFAEWEEVYEDIYYGTLQSEITRLWEEGKAVIFDIDVVGGLNLKKQYPDALSVFIAPPSLEVLEQRLSSRQTEDSAMLQKRVAKAQQELEFAPQFDAIVVNDELQEAKQEIISLVDRYLEN